MTNNIYFIGTYKVEGVENYASLEECVDFITKQKIIGIDIETTKKYEEGTYEERVYKGGLDPYLSRVVMLQLGTSERVYVIDMRCYSNEQLKPLTNYLNYNDKILLVGHNLKFEGKHLKHNYGIRMKNVWDTMICEINLTNGLPLKYGLANLAERYLDVKNSNELYLFEDLYSKKQVSMNDEYLAANEHVLTPFEVEDDFFVDKSTRLQFIKIGDKPFTKEQVLYGADDITMPLLIRERQLLGRLLKNGEIYNPTICHKIENTFTQTLADIELEGLGFRADLWKEIADKNEVIYYERLAFLNDYVTTLYPEFTAQPTLFNPKPDCIIDWASSKQVINFFRKLDICPKEVSKQTKRLDWTVGATTLIKSLDNSLKAKYMYNDWIGFDTDENGKFVENHERLILAYLLLKKTEQAITTFGKDWLKYVHPITGRVHSNFRQILNTSRMSSTNPNLQNISGGDYRKCFVAREGNKVLNADYAAQEIRIVADVTNDEAFVSFFLSGDETFGDDFHSYTATKMYRIMNNDPELIVPAKELNGEKNPEFQPEHNKMRNNAKAINFKINYGGSAFTLKDDFGVEEDVAQKFIDTYLDAFPTLRDNFKKVKREAVEKGFVVIDKYSDRRWFCPFHERMEELNNQVREYYPEGYFEGAYKGEAKDKVKAEVYETYPFLRDMWKEYFRYHGKLERAGLNYRIQGLAAMMMKMAMNILRHTLIKNGWDDFKLTNLVHDEALAEAPVEKAEEYAKLLSQSMIQGGTYFCKTVPMGASCVPSDVWEH